MKITKYCIGKTDNMRKVAFTSGQDNVKKVMIYYSSDGVYVFCYDCLQDTSSVSDYFQGSVETAEDFCRDEYNLESDNWILIPDPLDNCQHDFILPTRIKGRENGNPEWGCFQTLVDGRWIDIGTSDKAQSFDSMTVDERLLVSGLLEEFEKSKISDKKRARQILCALQVDEPSIDLLVR